MIPSASFSSIGGHDAHALDVNGISRFMDEDLISKFEPSTSDIQMLDQKRVPDPFGGVWPVKRNCTTDEETWLPLDS